MVLVALSLMLLLIALLGQLPMALLAEAEALSVREEALPLVHEALSHDCIELPVPVAGVVVLGVDCAWVKAGTAAMVVIKAAVAAIETKVFIWVVLVETGKGNAKSCAYLMPLALRTWPVCRVVRVKLS